MIRLLIQNWWLLLVRGMFAIAFAIFIFVFLPFVPAPMLRQLAFAGLATIFAVFAIATGLITIIAAVRGAGRGDRAWLLLGDGIVVTAGGFIIMIAPGLTLSHVIQVIAGMALILGLFEIAAGLHLRRHIADEWLLLLSGFISGAFAICLMFTPAADRRTALTWIALYAASGGFAMVGLALRLRKLRHSIHALAAPDLAVKAKSSAS